MYIALLLSLFGCDAASGTAPPPEGWANTGPIVVEEVVDRGDHQLLAVRQGHLHTWVRVPDVRAQPGDHLLLGQGNARHDIALPERDTVIAELVDIDHARVVDAETARRVVAGRIPADAVPVGTVYAELDERADASIVVYGTVVKSTPAVGSIWVHLQDGSGDVQMQTHDLTVKTATPVVAGQRVGFRGTLRKDVDLGFGYHYAALVEDGELIP